MWAMIGIVGVLTYLLAIFQLSQHNHGLLCSGNDQIYRGGNNRARPTAAVRGNLTRATGLQVQQPTA